MNGASADVAGRTIVLMGDDKNSEPEWPIRIFQTREQKQRRWEMTWTEDENENEDEDLRGRTDAIAD